jgi:hypothetical protein
MSGFLNENGCREAAVHPLSQPSSGKQYWVITIHNNNAFMRGMDITIPEDSNFGPVLRLTMRAYSFSDAEIVFLFPDYP